jgi:hypothetical protein
VPDDRTGVTSPRYTDRDPLRELLRTLVGRDAWEPRLGIGSFLTLEVGPEAEEQASGPPHGEYHLWIYCSAWRLDHGADLLCGSEDDRDRIANVITRLDGRTVTAAEVSDSLDLTVSFDDGSSLRAFPIFSDGYEHWMIFAPNGYVYTAGPGSTWTADLQAPVG